MTGGLTSDEFQAAFEAVYAPVADAHGLVRRRGRRLCWQHGRGALSVAFDFALNPKTARLLPHFPGEFALTISLPGGSGEPLKSIASLFQYTTDDEERAYAAIETQAIEKFLAGNPGMSELFPPGQRLPRPEHAQWSHFVDADDVRRWAAWHAAVMPAWLPRYAAAPESLHAWCTRVLWHDRGDTRDGVA